MRALGRVGRRRDLAMQMRDGDGADDWWILALALWQKREKDSARMWFDTAAGWTKQNAPDNAELRNFGPRPRSCSASRDRVSAIPPNVESRVKRAGA